MTVRAVIGELIGHGIAHGRGDLDRERHRLRRKRTGQQAVILLQHRGKGGYVIEVFCPSCPDDEIGLVAYFTAYFTAYLQLR